MSSDYPKSSCDCYGCSRVEYKPVSNLGPTNLAISDCQLPDILTCTNSAPISAKTIEPSPKEGYTILNPEVDTLNYASGFGTVECGISSCPKITYTSADPRLVSAMHNGQRLVLDRPPRDDSVLLDKTMTDETLNGFGQNYKTYSDINAGFITYYIDKSREDPFYEPLFGTSAYSHATLFRDPMGSLKPQYDRTSLTSTNPITSTRDHYEGCLSWMEDSTNHREDLLSKQMRKMNEQRWEPRWRKIDEQ